MQPLAGSAAASATGPSDLTLGGKLLLFDDEIAATIYGGVTLPVGDATAREPLGTGDVRVELGLSVGKLFERAPIFVDGRVGFALRGGATVVDWQDPSARRSIGYAPEVRYGAEVGYVLLPRVRGLRKLTVAALAEGAYGAAPRVEDGFGVLTAPSLDYLKLGSAIAWRPEEHVELSTSAGLFAVGASTPRMVEIALSAAALF